MKGGTKGKRPRQGKLQGGEGWVLVKSCPRCGRPADECLCRAAPGPAFAGKPTIRLRLERRSGKAVTVLASVGLSSDTLAALLKELKSLYATGGTVKGAEAELQGDHRERLRALLQARGILVKG